jgi:acyl-CoA dehydrogenase
MGEAMIDFAPEPEFQAKLDWIKKFCDTELLPLNYLLIEDRNNKRAGRPGVLDDAKLQEHIRRLQDEVKAQGLWALHLGADMGGPGLGQVKLCLVNEILSQALLAPTIFGTRAPDTGNAELIAHMGTPEQKKRWLEPLMRDEFRSCYSMTEPHAGSDPGMFKTRAWREDDGWVLDGVKWFSSYADEAELLIVMAITNPDAPLSERASMFLVPRHTPGVEIIRNVGVFGEPFGEGDHGYVRYDNVRLPADALLGDEGTGFTGSQTRLSGGRIHHAMRAVGTAQKALDMACERVLSRETKGSLLAEKQMVQEAIADSYIQLRQFRLHVLYAAWLIDRDKAYTREVRREIAAVKVSAPKVLLDIVQRCLQLHGSLGVSNETELAQMWTDVPWMGIVDGPTEVHKVTVARQTLRGYQPSDDLFPTYHLPRKIAEARARFSELIEHEVGAI